MEIYSTESLLFQIEELFEKFRNLPQSSRAVILEKIRIKLLEEFKDFVIEENDNTQDLIDEIPYADHAGIIPKNENYVILTNHDGNSEVSIMNSNMVENSSLSINQPSSVEPIAHDELKKEIKQPKSKYLRLMCNYCGKRFSRKNMFDHHMNRHRNERTFQCSTCSQQFNVKDDLTKHLKSHSGARNFVCLICQKQLVNNTTLQNHIRVIHHKQEKYACNKCDYFAYSKATLKEHIRIKHEKDFKKYACVICDRVYNSKVLLKVHLRSHTGEKPYSCKECDASFVSSGQLSNHMNSVHGQRKYPCEVCCKSFKTIHQLKRHSLIHTRVKPFACPFCSNYASNTQGNLSKHVKTVHQMNDFSYLKYKRIMQGDMEEMRKEWVENAETFTNNYLKKLSDCGKVISLDELKETHLLKKKVHRLESTS